MSWPRDAFTRAVWSSDLPPLQRLVALAYADHAAAADVAWVTYPRLLQRTGLKSNGAISKAIRGLVDAGWLTLVERGGQHRAPRYRLSLPAGHEDLSAPPDGGLVGSSAPSSGGVTESSPPLDGGLGESSPPPDASSPPPDASSPPRGGGNHSEDHSEDHSSIDARASATPLLDRVDPADRQVVAEILSRHAPGIAETDAIDCVLWIRATRKKVENLGGYVARFSAADIQTRAANFRQPTKTPPARGPARCGHGVTGGLRITGHGQRASRVCSKCEEQMPATEADMLAQEMMANPAINSGRGDIDWEAASARAEARDAAQSDTDSLSRPLPTSVVVQGEVVAS